jgi:hypothetical protein
MDFQKGDCRAGSFAVEVMAAIHNDPFMICSMRPGEGARLFVPVHLASQICCLGLVARDDGNGSNAIFLSTINKYVISLPSDDADDLSTHFEHLSDHFVGGKDEQIYLIRQLIMAARNIPASLAGFFIVSQKKGELSVTNTGEPWAK